MKLKEPYSISYETVDTCSNVFITLKAEDGFSGWGCAAPAQAVTGESARDVFRTFGESIEPVLKGRDVFEYARIMEVLKEVLPRMPSARAMVDMALLDIIAQKAGVPLYRLLGGYRHSVPTSITIGIMPLAETLALASNHIKRGFNILKIKGGIDVSEDIEKINRLREVTGKHITIRFDANQGYSLEDSLKFIEETMNAGIELLEQPTPGKNFELLKKVTRHTSVPVMADESLLSLRDVFHLSSERCTDLINIKLMKTGGILEAMHINSVAKAAGIKAMMGCMDESALGIAAGLHVTLSRPNIEYADLDGHLDLLDDPFEGLLSIRDGVLYPPEKPGLGWTGMEPRIP